MKTIWKARTYDNKLLYGYPVYMKQECYLVVKETENMKDIQWLLVRPETVSMQLPKKDLNDMHIWEGDRVRFAIYFNKMEGIVTFDETTFYIVVDGDYHYGFDRVKDVEVI